MDLAKVTFSTVGCCWCLLECGRNSTRLARYTLSSLSSAMSLPIFGRSKGRPFYTKARGLGQCLHTWRSFLIIQIIVFRSIKKKSFCVALSVPKKINTFSTKKLCPVLRLSTF
uniref:(northern house mosquito) hypothetical protein n=1 Tax=Culex pipiens TaxID=7175 RepID=A0A8D8DAT5_CULPI